jgi:pimeloyl-ACP methyl ester carboxylesterase
LTEAARDSYFEADGARLRFRDEGEGPSVLFIHGWALDLELWELEANELAATHRVLRLDRRGFGLSSGAPSLSADLRDVLALLDHLAVPRATLVGASHGARVALRVALGAPERVAALMLDGPPDELGAGRGVLTVEIPLDAYRRLAHGGNLSELRRRWAEHPFTQLTTRDEVARALLSQMLARYSGADLLLPAEVPSPLAPLDSLDIPIRVLNGERDLDSRRASGAALARALPGARHVVIPDAGHLPCLDNPEAYGSALRELLGALGPPPSPDVSVRRG